MKFWKKSLMMIILILSIIKLLTLIAESASSVDEKNLDLTNFRPGDPIDHIHIWEKKHDDDQHWEQCNTCGKRRNQEDHQLHGNGGRKDLCENGWYNQAYQEVCSCGFQTKPQVVLHGRYENYQDTHTLNYEDMAGKRLEDFKQISREEFNNTYKSENKSGGPEYTLEGPDVDKTGKGWVFIGGPVLRDENGTKGTIERILGEGKEGDHGRQEPFDEAYMLAKYIYNRPNITRHEFVNQLPAKENISTDHLLYGYREKYQNEVTDEQFRQLVDEFKEYNIKASRWGEAVMRIQHSTSTHNNHSKGIYSNRYCYDSHNHHEISFEDGCETNCDLCGAHFSGTESYTSCDFYRCSIPTTIQKGETKTCDGHELKGENNKTFGKIYDTFYKSTEGVVTRKKVEAHASNRI